LPRPVIDFSRHIAERTVDFSGREWVFRAVDRWLGDPEAARILLLTGEPGCGKTAIAARLVQFSVDAATPPDGVKRLKPGFLSARHFCSGDHRWISPHRFSEAVSHQLGRYPEFSEALAESLRPRAGEGKTPAQVIHQEVRRVEKNGVVIGSIIKNITVGEEVRPEHAFTRLVLEPLQALSPQEEGHKVVILVDALDEALAHSGKANIVSLLAGAKDLPKGVHFLLTCRNDSSLIGRFPSEDRLRINISSEEYSRQTEGDIGAYLKRRLLQPEIARRAAAVGSREDQRRKLVDKAAGNFLYLRFLLEEVAEGQRTLEDLEGLPGGLYGLYRTFLDRLMPDMKEGRSSVAWRKTYQPLLGCLSVAKEPVPAGLVADWLGRSEGEVRTLLNTELAQLLETDKGTDYRLYHRSMAEYLAASTYPENGATVSNLYYTPPYEGHDRIIRYYLDEFADAWDYSDAYGLRYLVGHLDAGRGLARKKKRKQELTNHIYCLVLKPEYRQAQAYGLGELGPTINDLRTALDVALENDDLVKILACAGAYRDTIASSRVLEAVFGTVKEGDLWLAVRRAEPLRRTPDWGAVLMVYLAWEAANAGDSEAARQAMDAARAVPLVEAGDLCDALLVRTARRLAQTADEGIEARTWLHQWRSEPEKLLSKFDVSVALDAGERSALMDAVRNLEKFERGKARKRAARRRELLTKLAADREAQGIIDRLMARAYRRRYTRYRDIKLGALGVACVAVPDRDWLRQRLQKMLIKTLVGEGVTFTFDLPAMLLAQAEKRGLKAPELDGLLATALTTYDRWWGTYRWAHSARAAASFRHGGKSGAWKELDEMPRPKKNPNAGTETIRVLSLMNRHYEFGESEVDLRLLRRARAEARSVYDPEFRAERRLLVEEYERWIDKPPPDLTTAMADLAKMTDHDTRMAYLDYVSSRWAGPSEDQNWEGLKALVPLALADGTTLDAILGRLVGLRVQQLSDEDLDEAIRICTESLASGRSRD
jgi:hypothetical protein